MLQLVAVFFSNYYYTMNSSPSPLLTMDRRTFFPKFIRMIYPYGGVSFVMVPHPSPLLTMDRGTFCSKIYPYDVFVWWCIICDGAPPQSPITQVGIILIASTSKGHVS